MGRYKLIPALVMTCPLLPCLAADPQPAPKALREKVLMADSPDEKAKAYKDLFLAVGKTGLADLTNDEDTGIALQAAWEEHKKAITRPKLIPNRADDVYDPAELKKFLAFLKDRTKAPVPDWWGEAITSVDLFPGQHHGFIDDVRTAGPKLRKSKAGALVPEGAELEAKGDTLVYTAAGRSVTFPKDTFRGPRGGFTGLLGKTRSVVAHYEPSGGFGYQLAGFEGTSGKPAWTASVWAAGRTFLGGYAHHRAELTQRGDTVFMFGMESHGMYLEAFNLKTGKCRFRFCTGYWFDFSEAWGLQ